MAATRPKFRVDRVDSESRPSRCAGCKFFDSRIEIGSGKAESYKIGSGKAESYTTRPRLRSLGSTLNLVQISFSFSFCGQTFVLFGLIFGNSSSFIFGLAPVSSLVQFRLVLNLAIFANKKKISLHSVLVFRQFIFGNSTTRLA